MDEKAKQLSISDHREPNIPTEQAIIRFEKARHFVNASAPASWKEFLDAKSIGTLRDSAAKADPKQFVGFIEDTTTGTGMRYVTFNFDGEKWTFCGYPEDDSCWSPREVYRYDFDPDVWTLYYPDGYRIFLRHVKNVEVPKHKGKQVLAGWLLKAGPNGGNPLARMGLINDDTADGSILTQLWPQK
ncbi:MAG: hypothetical protein HC883_03475 [Bdellovibrionaceae bacterium]|nr:hypothetical protein [Pseudobdellovibrionaceae bacterium]